MLVKFKISLITLVVILSQVNCENLLETKTEYSLKCVKSQLDGKICNVVVESSESKHKRGDDTFLKKLFEKVLPTISYKANDVSCLTEDCDIQTLKIRKMDKKMSRNGQTNFACVGNPYTHSGSKCYPIEGLYIG